MTTENSRDSSGEFQREPVPGSSLLGFKSFVGMLAGEQSAGTELMVGPLFVVSGVGGFDLLVGQLLGNLLAVLSWTWLTAPIASWRRLKMEGDFNARLPLVEEFKLMPVGAVWDDSCEWQDTAPGAVWLDQVCDYQRDVLSRRSESG